MQKIGIKILAMLIITETLLLSFNHQLFKTKEIKFIFETFLSIILTSLNSYSICERKKFDAVLKYYRKSRRNQSLSLHSRSLNPRNPRKRKPHHRSLHHLPRFQKRKSKNKKQKKKRLLKRYI